MVGSRGWVWPCWSLLCRLVGSAFQYARLTGRPGRSRQRSWRIESSCAWQPAHDTEAPLVSKALPQMGGGLPGPPHLACSAPPPACAWLAKNLAAPHHPAAAGSSSGSPAGGAARSSATCAGSCSAGDAGSCAGSCSASRAAGCAADRSSTDCIAGGTPPSESSPAGAVGARGAAGRPCAAAARGTKAARCLPSPLRRADRPGEATVRRPSPRHLR